LATLKKNFKKAEMRVNPGDTEKFGIRKLDDSKGKSMNQFKYVLWLGAVGLTTSLVAIPAFAAEIEEVIVTGSYIKRDSFDRSSPVEVMNEAKLVEQGTPNLGEVLRNSTYNQGVESVGNILSANPQGSGEQSANFRGLGERATLTLLNGRRTLTTNLANLYPQLMIQRTESLTSGGATLYGTDAVGGVFNIIPKTNFEGIEIQIGTNQADEWYENSLNFVTGFRGDRGGMVAGFEIRRKDALNFAERPEYYLGSASYSSTSWPGDFSVANRDATGAIINTTSRADPGCGLNNTAVGTTPTARKAEGITAQRQGIRVGSCRWEFGANFDYQDDQDTFTAAVLYDYEITDNLILSGEIMISRNEIEARGSPSNPGGRQGELTAIPGDNPGNPYRAFFDVDLDGVYDVADGDALLFAVDANGDGIPDRNPGVDLDNNGTDDVLVSGTDPTAGIAFNEDVVVVDWRPVGLPIVGPSRLNSDATSNGFFDSKITNIRFVQQLDFDINEDWSGYVSYIYNRRELIGNGRDESLSAINAGINGTLTVRDEATASSRTAYFNPFATQNFACVNRDCSGGTLQTDPNQINTPDIYDQIAFEQPNVTVYTRNIIEAVFVGDLFEMPAGTVGAAAGIQYRDISFELDANAQSNALDLWIGIGSPDFTVDRQTTAVFGELSIPLIENLTVDLSIRDETVDDDAVNDLDQTTYSVGFKFSPVDFASFRASWNTSFIAPSLNQLYDSPTLQGLSQITDGFTGNAAFTARTTGGTPTLKPEEADIYNIGATFLLLDDDLRIEVDYKYFDFTDRIIRPAAQEILDADEANAVANGFALTEAGLAAYEASGMNNGGIIRSNLPGRLIQLITTDQLNAQSMEWKGWDLSANYSFQSNEIPWVGGEYGDFEVGVNATYVSAYDFTSFTGAKVEGAGKRNYRVAAVPSTPEWKANFRFAWHLNNHHVTAYARYLDGIDEVRDGDPFSSTSPGVRGFFALLGVTNPTPDSLPSYTTWDFQYSVDLEGLIGDGNTNVQVGLLNAFDKEAQPIVTLGGLESQLYDPRGQTWYLRIRQGI
jgi:iron complex outermembrane receptor protein